MSLRTRILAFACGYGLVAYAMFKITVMVLESACAK